jgi:ABC-type multidrug transport system fused ATPase/permease subunit
MLGLAALVMMFMYSPSLSVVVAAAALLYGLVRWASFVPFRNAAAERMVLAGQEQGHFIETLRAMTPLKLFGREHERRSRWQSLIVEVMNRYMRTTKMKIGFTVLNSFIFRLENLLVYWLGAKAILASQGSGSGTAVLLDSVFAAVAAHPHAPHLERARFQVLPHQGDHLGFVQTVVQRNRLKRGAVVPSHGDDLRGVGGAQPLRRDGFKCHWVA